MVGTEPSARILLVEDDRDTRDVVAELIEDEGFQIRALPSVHEALELVDKESFSLILTDVWDCGSARWQEIAQLIELAAPTPVAACTASRGTPPEPISSRLSFFLQKPFSPERLLELLAEQAGDPASVDSYRPVVAAYFDALSRKDWKLLASICTDDVRYFFPTQIPGYGKQVRGREAFIAFSKATFDEGPFASAKFELLRLLPLRSGAVAEFRSSWTTQANQSARAEGSIALRFSGGKISRIGVRIDLRKWAFA